MAAGRDTRGAPGAGSVGEGPGRRSSGGGGDSPALDAFTSGDREDSLADVLGDPSTPPVSGGGISGRVVALIERGAVASEQLAQALREQTARIAAHRADILAAVATHDLTAKARVEEVLTALEKVHVAKDALAARAVEALEKALADSEIRRAEAEARAARVNLRFLGEWPVATAERLAYVAVIATLAGIDILGKIKGLAP